MTDQPDLKARVEELAAAVVNRIAPLAYTAGPNTRAAIFDALAPLLSGITELEAERDEWREKYNGAAEACAQFGSETEAAESRLALAGAVVEAGKAVVARWDTPLWKDVQPTADFINELRAALAAYEEGGGASNASPSQPVAMRRGSNQPPSLLERDTDEA